MKVLNKVGVIKYIYQAVLDNTPQNIVLKKLRGMIQNTPDFNIREKAAMYRTVKRVVELMYVQEGKLENGQIKNYSVSLNKIEEHRNARKRKQNLVDDMRVNRAKQGVFYMSSIHSNPAKDHAAWQGVIYVDRYWRSITDDDPELQKKVAAYIRNHDTLTVQEIIGEPVYLITRPYCKHFFIALDTDEVLGNGLKKIQRDHPEAHTRSHNVYYRKKYYRLRERIHTVLNMESEAEWDKKLIKRNSGR